MRSLEVATALVSTVHLSSCRFSHTFFPQLAPPCGGILADEMGLGKTVEVLALILAHRWSDPSQPDSEKATSNEDVTDGLSALHPVSEKDYNMESSSVGLGELPSGEGEMPEEESEYEDGESVLCLCGAVESQPGDSLVLCERCEVWQHIKCSGYCEEKDGEIFICTRCLLKDVCWGWELVLCYRGRGTIIICKR